MGFALPAAIGAKVSRPDAEVWTIAGDGGFQMTMAELATIKQEGLDVKIAVINNGYLGMVRQWQEFFYERRYAATPLLSPDFAKVAEAYGLRGDDGQDARRGHPGDRSGPRPRRAPCVIDFQVEQEDTVYPMVPGRRRSARDDPPAVADRRDGHGGSVTSIDPHVFVVDVEDEPGVLTRVSSLFRRRAFNIVSLTVGVTERPGVSRMTIVVDAPDVAARRIEAHLWKLVNVIRVEDVTRAAAVRRELVDGQGRRRRRGADPRHEAGRSVPRARHRRLAGLPDPRDPPAPSDKIAGLLDVLRPFGVLEVARSGHVAMVRGRAAKRRALRRRATSAATPDNVSYSV